MTQTNEIVRKLEKILGCNCGLGNWQPEIETGHSGVCRIHERAILYSRGIIQLEWCGAMPEPMEQNG